MMFLPSSKPAAFSCSIAPARTPSNAGCSTMAVTAMRFVPEAAEAPAFPAAAEALLPADCWLQAANTAAAIKLNKAVRRVNIFHLLLLLMNYSLKI